MAKKKNRIETEEEKFKRISNGNYTTFDTEITGSKSGGQTTISERNAEILLNNKRKQEEEENRSAVDWLNRKDKSDNIFKQTQNQYEAGLSQWYQNNKESSQPKNIFNSSNKGLFEKQEPAFESKPNILARANYNKTEEGNKQYQKMVQADDERVYNQAGLERAMAKEDVKNANPIQKVGMAILSGFADAGSILRQDLVDSTGTRQYSYGENIEQQLPDSADTIVGKYIYKILPELSKQSVWLAGNMVSGGVGGKLTQFIDVASDSYNTAKKNGASEEAAIKYGVALGGLDFAWNKVFSNVSNIVNGDTEKGIVGEYFYKLMQKVSKNEAVANTVATFMSEGFEEFSQEYAETFLEHTLLEVADKGEKFDISKIINEETIKNSIESFVVGGVVGATYEGGNRLLRSKSAKTYDQVLYNYERYNKKLSAENENLVAGIINGYEEIYDRKPTVKDVMDTFENKRQAQIDKFENSAVEMFPDLDNDNRVLYNNLINDISKVIYNTGINVEFNQNIDTVAEWNGNTLIMNPTITDMPIKTILLKELSTKTLNNSTKQYILSYLKENGVYDTLKRDLINSEEFDSANVDNEIVARELNSIFDDSEKLKKFIENNKEETGKLKKTIDNLVAEISNKRETKDAVFLRNLGDKLANVDIINNNTNYKELTTKQTDTKLNEEVAKTTENQVNAVNVENNLNDNVDRKQRKTYLSVIESDNQTQQAKEVSKKLLGLDTYVPDSNKAQLQRADNHINKYGVDETLKMLQVNTENNRNNVDDIAIGNRLIEYYSKIGDEAKLQDAMQFTAMAGTNLGRGVQAMSLINRQTPTGKATWIQRSVDQLNKKLQEAYDKNKLPGKKLKQFDFTAEMQKKIINSTDENIDENVEEVLKELGNQVQMSKMEALETWRYFAMLSAPTTHIRNIVGNLTMGKMQGIKNKIRGGIEDIYYNATGKEGERTSTLRKTSKKYLEFAEKDLPNVKDRLSGSKYLNPKNAIQQNQRMFKSDLAEKIVKKGAIDTVSNLLEAEDVGKVKVGKSEIKLGGLEAAYKKAMAQYLNANKIDLDKITDSQLARARNFAIDEAKQATFHQDNSLATLLNTLENKNLASKLIVGGLIPFKKTPLNVAATSLRYNPAGLLWTLTGDTVRLNMGQITVNEYIDNISKGLTGTAVALVGYALAQMGVLRTTSDDDDKYDEDKGLQPYSIVLGDKTISLDWLSPTAVPLFVGAELEHQFENMGKDMTEEEKNNSVRDSFLKVLDAGVSSLNPVSEMTMLSGIQNAVRTYSGDYAKAIEEVGTNTIKNYVSQIVPSILGKVARITDDYERATTSTKKGTVEKAIDQFLLSTASKIPGLRQTLSKKTDVWGNEVKQESNLLLRTAYNLVSPAIIKNVRGTKVDEEIDRLYQATGESGVLPKTYITKELTYDNKKYRLTNQEYQTYKQFAGKENYEKINQIISNKEYQALNDSEKVEVIKNIFSYDNDAIKVAYAKTHNISYEDTTKKTEKKVENLGGNVGEYYLYNVKTKNIKGDGASYEKNKTLKNMDISNASKSAIYEAQTSKATLDLYKVLKESDININDYLDYLSVEFKADKKANGDTISGSKKAKEFNYMNNKSNLTYEQKLLILSRSYALSNSEKTYVAYRIQNSDLTTNEKLELYKSINGFKVSDDGTVRW